MSEPRSTADPRAAVAILRHRFTVEDFARLGEAGVFTEDDRVELIDGELRDMTPIGQPHAWIVNRLINPLRLDGHTEPQPDLVVAWEGEDDYVDRHLEAGDVLLVIEVADSSLRYDRAEKMPRHGISGIPEACLVDVTGGAVTVYTTPGAGGYASEQVFQPGAEIASTAVAGLSVTVDEIVGRIDKPRHRPSFQPGVGQRVDVESLLLLRIPVQTDH